MSRRVDRERKRGREERGGWGGEVIPFTAVVTEPLSWATHTHTCTHNSLSLSVSLGCEESTKQEARGKGGSRAAEATPKEKEGTARRNSPLWRGRKPKERRAKWRAKGGRLSKKKEQQQQGERGGWEKERRGGMQQAVRWEVKQEQADSCPASPS